MVLVHRVCVGVPLVLAKPLYRAVVLSRESHLPQVAPSIVCEQEAILQQAHLGASWQQSALTNGGVGLAAIVLLRIELQPAYRGATPPFRIRTEGIRSVKKCAANPKAAARNCIFRTFEQART
jgi:hypothetical protein